MVLGSLSVLVLLVRNIDIFIRQGWEVEVKLYAPLEGAKVFRGVLLPSGENGEVRIDDKGKTLEFARSAVAKINTVFEF